MFAEILTQQAFRLVHELNNEIPQKLVINENSWNHSNWNLPGLPKSLQYLKNANEFTNYGISLDIENNCN